MFYIYNYIYIHVLESCYYSGDAFFLGSGRRNCAKVFFPRTGVAQFHCSTGERLKKRHGRVWLLQVFCSHGRLLVKASFAGLPA